MERALLSRAFQRKGILLIPEEVWKVGTPRVVDRVPDVPEGQEKVAGGGARHERNHRRGDRLREAPRRGARSPVIVVRNLRQREGMCASPTPPGRIQDERGFRGFPSLRSVHPRLFSHAPTGLPPPCPLKKKDCFGQGIGTPLHLLILHPNSSHSVRPTQLHPSP